MPYPVIDPVLRFWKRVDAGDPGGCWLWTGGRAGQGRYGALSLEGGKQVAAHRFSYELANGPIPDGMQIDHLCRETLCVRPDHLEAVTCAENVARSSLGIKERSKTHCANGHPYDDVNTFRTKAGKRVCLTCRRAQGRSRYARHPEKWVQWREAKRARDLAASSSPKPD